MNNELNNWEVQVSQGVLLEQTISDLRQKTSLDVLNTIYKNESVLSKVFSVLNWFKINPSDLTEELSMWREQYIKLKLNEL